MGGMCRGGGGGGGGGSGGGGWHGDINVKWDNN